MPIITLQPHNVKAEPITHNEERSSSATAWLVRFIRSVQESKGKEKAKKKERNHFTRTRKHERIRQKRVAVTKCTACARDSSLRSFPSRAASLVSLIVRRSPFDAF